jgi:hypothetical protein
MFSMAARTIVQTGACFTQTAAVAGANNEAERTLRTPAMARDTGRASKTLRGAADKRTS